MMMKVLVAVLLLSISVNAQLGMMVGGPTESTTTIQEALKVISSAEEFAKIPKATQNLKKIFGQAKVLKYTSQVVAGTNKAYLLSTKRGFECFRIYVRFTGKASLSKYGRGTSEDNVWGECTNFAANSLTAIDLAKSVFKN